MPTDTERIDFLQKLTDRKKYTGKVKKGETASLLVRRRGGFIALNITK